MQISEDDYALQQKLCHPNEGDLLAKKRLRSETQKEKEDQTAKKAKYKANREAKRVTKMQEMINQEKMQEAGPSRLANACDTTSGDPSTSAAVDNQFNDTVSPTMQSSCCEPLLTDDAMQASTINSMNDQERVNNVSPPKSPVVSLPRKDSRPVLPDPIQMKPPVFQTKTSTIIEELRDQKVFNLSYNQIVALSSKAQLENVNAKDISNLLLNQEVGLPEGRRAPRTVGKINGTPAVNVILNTGCTPCVISHQLVQKLGLAEQMVMLPKSSHGGIMVGDGRRVQIKGILKDLKLQLLPGHDRLVDAACLDVAGWAYEFLCGRIVMAKFEICVDLGTSSWFIRNGKEL